MRLRLPAPASPPASTVPPMPRLLALAIFALALLPASAAAAPPTPFGHACAPKDGVRFCPTTGLADRVASFDGVPLDVDVTLPPSGDGPFPTIVMLHGYGGSKTDYETEQSSTTYHWNAEYFAKRGYAVVNTTARGFGQSCGAPASRTPDCAQGWLHLADQRFEARDTQTLLGLLADQGIAKPGALGVTGISYGGGQSLELAYLRDRIRRADGSFAPWKSPKGTPLAIAAAYPRWPWSDLVNALLPNGRFLDYRVSGPTESRVPIGVSIQSYTTALYGLGSATGYYSPPGVDPGADLTTWNAKIQAGEPYGADARAIADEIHDHHQGYGLSGHPGAAAAARRLDRRPLPARGDAARLQRAARRQPRGAGVAAARRPRPRARLEQGQRRPRLQRRRLGVLRRLPARHRLAARARPRHRLHADLPAGRGRRRPVRRRELARAAPRRRAVRRGRRADRQLQRRQPGDLAGLRPDQRRRRRLPQLGEGDRAGHRLLRRPRGGRLHAARPPDDQRHDRHQRRQRPARRAAVGRRAGRLAGARHPRHLPAARQPERQDHVPAQRQRLPLREGPRAAARAARPRLAVLPRQQRLVQRRGLEAPGRAAGRRAPRLRARRRLTARRAAARSAASARGSRSRPATSASATRCACAGA